MQDELSIEKARVAILVEERNELLRKVFELEEQVRRLTQRAPDAPNWVCRNCDAENPPINTNCYHCNGTARW